VLAVADCPLAPPGALDTVLGRRFPAGEVDVVVDAGGAVHTTCTSGVRPGGDGAGEDHAGDDGSVPVRAAGREWRLSPGVFWQVHPALPDVLAQVVGEWAAAPRGGTAWDLYGGVGLFAAVLAEQVGPDGSVTVVESARAAVDDGRAAPGRPPAGRVARRAGWRRCSRACPAPPDVVVADPPRRGSAGRWSTRWPRTARSGWCTSPATPPRLARDVAFFAERGYTLASCARSTPSP
jgi:tRNA/tmRNA/rRNA uracil-C5-methylase (TrmA/RlmC/RlmD family)